MHECNLIPDRRKGSEDDEVWMSFAKKVDVLTMSRNLLLLFRKKMLHPIRLGIFALISSSKFGIFYMKYKSDRSPATHCFSEAVWKEDIPMPILSKGIK